jgi:tRNA (guanine-N7-)-methyltransferase
LTVRARASIRTPLVPDPSPARRPRPYDDAPRLSQDPEARIELSDLVRGAWLELEIGPGPKAGFLVERAAAAPEAALVGLEIRKKWAAVGDARLAKLGYAARARVFCENALLALPRLGPDACVRRVFLHFPDPWWKKRHQKRLVMGDAFLDEVARLLEPGGELYVQTDVPERAELYGRVVSAHPRFTPAGDEPGSFVVAENPYGARSPREHRAAADGLPVHRLRWRRA